MVASRIMPARRLSWWTFLAACLTVSEVARAWLPLKLLEWVLICHYATVSELAGVWVSCNF